jgi:hypothetical protein
MLTGYAALRVPSLLVVMMLTDPSLLVVMMLTDPSLLAIILTRAVVVVLGGGCVAFAFSGGGSEVTEELQPVNNVRTKRAAHFMISLIPDPAHNVKLL